MIRRCKNFHKCDAADSTNSTCIKSAGRELGGMCGAFRKKMED